MTTTPVVDDAMKRVYGLESKCLALEADCARWESLAKENESALDKAKARLSALEVVKTNAIAERDATIRALENRVRQLTVAHEHAAGELEQLKQSLDVRTAEVDALLRDRIRPIETPDAIESSDDTAAEMLHLKREVMTYRAHFSAFTHDMDAIRLEMDHCNTTMRDIRAILAGKDEENAKHAQRLARLEAELEDGVQTMRTFAARDAKRANELAITRRALDAAKAHTRRLEAELDVLDFAAKGTK